MQYIQAARKNYSLSCPLSLCRHMHERSRHTQTNLVVGHDLVLPVSVWGQLQFQFFPCINITSRHKRNCSINFGHFVLYSLPIPNMQIKDYRILKIETIFPLNCQLKLNFSIFISYTQMCKIISNRLRESVPAGRRKLRREFRLPIVYNFLQLSI